LDAAAGGAAPPKLKPPPVEAALEAASAALDPPNAGLCAAVEEAPVPPKLKPPPVDAADDAAAPNENAMGNELLQARERCCRAARRKRRVLLPRASAAHVQQQLLELLGHWPGSACRLPLRLLVPPERANAANQTEAWTGVDR
jgi:hypothetical protein